VTWPNGAWPHSGHAITAEEHHWIPCQNTGGIVPVSRTGREPVAYDAIVTKSPGYVLGVQGADCPSIFLYDQAAQVIGLAHSGWKPVVRGVVRNTVELMVKLGASPGGIRAFIGPGVGDQFNEFQWDEAMEPRIRDVFVMAGREDLLTDRSIRHVMTDEDCEQVRVATGRDIREGTALALSGLIVRNLMQEGVKGENIDVSGHSTICERYPEQGIESAVYRYHSARRDAGKDPERPGFGVNLCVLFLKELS
jgi:copper oxidase (laccase) domain-containing protein